MTRQLLTYYDCIENLKEWVEAYSSGKSASLPAIRRAVLDAYQETASAHKWGFLKRNGRLHLYPRQTTGTVQYTHSTRTLTLTGATWPDWSLDGSVRFGRPAVICDVASVSDTTNLILDPVMNYGRNVAAGSSYVIYQRWLWLPEDFVSFSGTFGESTWILGEPISMEEMLFYDRYQSTAAEIRYNCVAEVPDVYDRKALFIYPQNEAQRTADFIYQRRSRELRYSGHEANDYVGTVAVTSGSADVVGTSTVFNAKHVGSIIWIGTDGTNTPTGLVGAYPYGEQRSILSVTDATHITLDGEIETTGSGLKYRITDPIDIGWVAQPAFLRDAEYKLAMARNVTAGPGGISARQLRDAADRALLDAMAADNTDQSKQLSDRGYPSWKDGNIAAPGSFGL